MKTILEQMVEIYQPKNNSKYKDTRLSVFVLIQYLNIIHIDILRGYGFIIDFGM